MEHICCGCSACALVCPTNAIKMKVNEDGFYTADIDKEKCIHCGLCDKICIYNNDKTELGEKIANKGLYSAHTKNEKSREQCSSGGIANEIAEEFIKKGYAIVGVVYDSENAKAKHIVVNEDNKNLLEELKGSKYLQSENYDAFNNIITMNKKSVIFGTPCQIAGIAKVLESNKRRENFILIDIFCHGVPSYNLWKRYLEKLNEEYKTGNTPNVIFRNKKKGWHEYNIKISSNENIYENERKKDIFYRCFLNSICDSETCYQCKFRNTSCADIRLGDYWGERYAKDEKGYSMVAVNTELGQEILGKLENINIQKTDIKERFSQQTINIGKPKGYKKNLRMLRENNTNFGQLIFKIKMIDIINRLKRKIKRVIIRSNNGGK